MARKNQQKSFRKIKAAVRSAIQQPAKGRRLRKQRTPRLPVTKIGRALRNAGSLVGGYFGNSRLGREGGAMISRVFGQGDYVTNAPMSNSLMSGGPPSFSPLTSGFRIRHREYIKDIYSSTNFDSSVFRINPGLPDLFPWLHLVAKNFEEYKIHGMIVWLNSSSATAVSSTNTALGIWGVVTQYDAAEPDFVNKTECLNYVGAQSTVPSRSLMHGIECKPGTNVLEKYFVRVGDLSPDLDIKFYDQGKVEVFTQGSQAVSDIGELWVSYDIEFTKPRLSNLTIGAGDVFDVNAWVDGSNLFSDGIIPAEPVNGGSRYTSIGLNNTITFTPESPVGYYMVSLMYQGSSTSNAWPVTAQGTGSITLQNTFAGEITDPRWFAPSAIVGSQRFAIHYMAYKGSHNIGSMIFNPTGSVLPTGTKRGQVYVVKLPDGFNPQPTSLTKTDVYDMKTLVEQLKKIPLDLLSTLNADDFEIFRSKKSPEIPDSVEIIKTKE